MAHMSCRFIFLMVLFMPTYPSEMILFGITKRHGSAHCIEALNVYSYTIIIIIEIVEVIILFPVT